MGPKSQNVGLMTLVIYHMLNLGLTDPKYGDIWLQVIANICGHMHYFAGKQQGRFLNASLLPVQDTIILPVVYGFRPATVERIHAMVHLF